MTNKDKYQLMLKNQIRQAGQWLIDNSEKMVSDIQLISDFQININLKNGDEIPILSFEQTNVVFWDSREYEKELKEIERYEQLEKEMRHE